MSNSENGYVDFHYFSNFHFDFKMVSCRMSNLRNDLCYVHDIFLLICIGSMSDVDFKKWLCRTFEFKGQGPCPWEEQVGKLSLRLGMGCAWDPGGRLR